MLSRLFLLSGGDPGSWIVPSGWSRTRIRGEGFLLTVGAFVLTVELLACSLFRRFLDADTHCKKNLPTVSTKAPTVSKITPTVSRKLPIVSKKKLHPK